MKTCIKCKETKGHDLYYKATNSRDGFQSVCKACDRIRRKKQYHEKPELSHKSMIARKYGITIDQYDSIWSAQGCKCAICGAEKNYRTIKGKKTETRMAVDHCHTTGNIRGLLCYTCNVGIGMLQDDTNILKAAINYLDSEGD